MALEIGMTGSASETVTEEKTARRLGSGELPVYGTPAMTALMEKAACNAVAGQLDDGKTTVGTMLNIKHLMSTPLGGAVSASAEITEIDGRRIVFRVSASDEAGIIGEGTHERFIVTSSGFMARSEARQSEAKSRSL